MGKKTENRLKSGKFPVFQMGLLLAFGLPMAGKQRLILQLREPLKSAPAQLVLPAVINARGETRDLKVDLQLGDSTVPEDPGIRAAPSPLALDMTVRPAGRHGLWIHMTLPKEAFVEVLLMDVYGKNLGTLFAGQCKGEMEIRSDVPQESEPGGLRLLAMRVNGKIAVRRVVSQIKG